MRTLLIDNYDSFTYNLYDYIKQLDIECDVMRNDDPALLKVLPSDYDNLVLSPGPETPSKAGKLLSVIKAYHDRLPMLGICLGHQAIGTCFGATLVKAAIPMHGKPVKVRHTGHQLFQDIPSEFEVMCYHSLLIDVRPGLDLDVLAKNEEGDVMAVIHKRFPCFGVQFHPESILTPNGMKLLENWFRLIRERPKAEM